LRYALDSNKIKRKLKWKANTKLLNGLQKTFMWYFDNNKYYKSLPKKDIIKRLGVKK
ncbi:MAG: dTDP-glucose 4,6-dehydratase, partial [Pelagibacterales bacterium]|nr:dTDP-glucose 4,6-dehydratase [Pelagibacterales bacterium]